MKSYFEKLVDEHGLLYAREYMRSIRAKVKKPGLANVPKEDRSAIAQKGWETRRSTQGPPTEEELRTV